MKNAKVIVPIITVLVGLGVGFFCGIKYRSYQISVTRGYIQRGTNGNFGRGSTVGSIVSMDDKSITVKLNDGSSKIVLLSGSTTYSNTATATKTDLKSGSTVAVFGTPNSDGSVTATTVQINPSFGRTMASPATQGQ